ncbi:MAG: UvrD-helicase domain-containing protein, partial [Clostridia bacterium]
MIDYGSLNEIQRQAVLDTEGSVLVFAGAGSGKTRVLTMRIANIIEKGLARPYEILAITFTNKAANEMKERLSKLVGDISSMWVCTIHSMCARILRSDIDKIGFEKSFSIYTDTEKDRLIKDIIKEQGYDEELFKTAKWHISNAKSMNIPLENYEAQNEFVKDIQTICDIMSRYGELLKKSNALDFDDLLTKTYELLKADEEVRNKYSSRFKYIHIDEFQDTNNIQYDIVKMLYSTYKNVFAVGDDDQSIYGFRGANVKNILNFEKDFPNAKIYKLEQNYRSTKKILEVANTIIKKNITRADKALWCENDEGVRIEYNSAYNETDEASYVAGVIKALTSVNGYKYNDIAVLYRMNSLSRSFEQEFMKYNVPYKVFGGLKFYERKEIKDLTAYLRAIVNPKDTEAIKRIINVPKRGIGDTTVAKLMRLAESEGKYFYEILEELEKYPEFNGATKNKLIIFRDTYFSLINEIKDYSPVEYINQVLERTQFKAQFEAKSEDNISRLLNIGEF